MESRFGKRVGRRDMKDLSADNRVGTDSFTSNFDSQIPSRSYVRLAGVVRGISLEHSGLNYIVEFRF